MHGDKTMSPQEALALTHYGVKGMKWGVVKARDARITKARQNLRPTADAMNSATVRKVKSVVKLDNKGRKAANRDLGRLKAKMLNNPDLPTALKMKSGEMALQLIFPPTAAGNIAGRELQSRIIARQQTRGGYEQRGTSQNIRKVRRPA